MYFSYQNETYKIQMSQNFPQTYDFETVKTKSVTHKVLHFDGKRYTLTDVFC